MEVCDLFFSSLIVLDMFNILFTDFFIIAQPGGKLKIAIAWEREAEVET